FATDFSSGSVYGRCARNIIYCHSVTDRVCSLMTKVDTYIEIARTSNAAFSSMGSESGAMIQSALEEHYMHVGISILNDLTDLELLVRKAPDLVFLGLKRLPNDASASMAVDDIWVSDYLDQHGIKYTGSSKAAIQLDFNKEQAKRCVQQAGLPTAPF